MTPVDALAKASPEAVAWAFAAAIVREFDRARLAQVISVMERAGYEVEAGK